MKDIRTHERYPWALFCRTQFCNSLARIVTNEHDAEDDQWPTRPAARGRALRAHLVAGSLLRWRSRSRESMRPRFLSWLHAAVQLTAVISVPAGVDQNILQGVGVEFLGAFRGHGERRTGRRRLQGANHVHRYCPLRHHRQARSLPTDQNAAASHCLGRCASSSGHSCRCGCPADRRSPAGLTALSCTVPWRSRTRLQARPPLLFCTFLLRRSLFPCSHAVLTDRPTRPATTRSSQDAAISDVGLARRHL
jgi:hypothetical protein